MANNIRNARTTFPRKTARRERAAFRFKIKAKRLSDKEYMDAKAVEAAALGLPLVKVPLV